MKIYYVYLLTRDDGKQYIGTTDSEHYYNRMYAHSHYNPRFRNHQFNIQIILCGLTEDIHEYEEYFIGKYNTFYNGLNASIDGKGNHLCSKFTTKGYKHSEETKRKMRKAWKNRIPTRGWKHKENIKLYWSKIRKGKIWGKCKPIKILLQIEKLYNSKPNLVGVGKISKNGRLLPYKRAFSKKYAKRFELTPNGLYEILNGRQTRCLSLKIY